MAEEVLNDLLEELLRRRRNNIFMRHLRDLSDPFDLAEENFRGLYRLSREAARHVFAEIEGHLHAPQRRTATPSVVKFFVALHFLAHGNAQKCIGKDRHTSMSQPNVSRCLHATVDAIVNVLHRRYIKFPTMLHEIANVKERFFEKYDLPSVIGCIDCTHVNIFPPPYDHPQHPAHVFMNRKGKHSINVQIIGDADLKILAINARYPGSTHDAAIWMLSSLILEMLRRYRNGDHISFRIGDSGYPLQPFLMTPIVGANPNEPEGRYTIKLSQIRNTIERVNGNLKGSFRCLRGELYYNPIFSANIIYACAILHNIRKVWNVIDNEEDFFHDDDNDDQNEDEHFVNDHFGNNLYQEGLQARNNLIRQFFNY